MNEVLDTIHVQKKLVARFEPSFFPFPLEAVNLGTHFFDTLGLGY